MTTALLQQLHSDPGCRSLMQEGRIQYQAAVSLKTLTTFRTGGTADHVLYPTDPDALCALIRVLQGTPWVVLGNGSNVLAPDEGIHCPVISTLKMKALTIEGNFLYAQAGVGVTRLALEAQKSGLTGLEFLYGIPGTVGGAAVMNAGAYEHQLSERVIGVWVCDRFGNAYRLSAQQADLSYRHSRFQTSGEIVTGVEFSLEPGNKVAIRQTMEDLMQRRRDKQPLEYPSAGSYFKRPAGHFAGKLIQDCQLKGTSVGGAQVSEKHAGFFINTGRATTNEILELEEIVRQKVHKTFGVSLECEVEKLSPWGKNR